MNRETRREHISPSEAASLGLDLALDFLRPLASLSRTKTDASCKGILGAGGQGSSECTRDKQDRTCFLASPSLCELQSTSGHFGPIGVQADWREAVIIMIIVKNVAPAATAAKAMRGKQQQT